MTIISITSNGQNIRINEDYIIRYSKHRICADWYTEIVMLNETLYATEPPEYLDSLLIKTAPRLNRKFNNE